jgi:formylglycine-generating enzyme required for sulfatase activity
MKWTILSVSLILSSLFLTPNSMAAPGDVNGDTMINQADAALIKDHLLERAPLTGDLLARADVNRDGAVDLKDVVWTVNLFDANAGQVFVDMTPDTGRWTLAGPAGFEGNAQTYTGDRAFTRAPASIYTLNCQNNIPGYNPPGAQAGNLVAGKSILFTPAYTPVSVTTLTITGMISDYSSPYLLDFTFSLRDQNNHAVTVPPHNFQVTAKEDDTTISLTESAFILAGAANKQLKSFLVLDYTNSMADPFVNGDSDGDGISDAIETMEQAAKGFISVLNPDAQLGIFEFHREDQDPATTGKVADFTTDKGYLQDRIDAIWADYVKWFPASSRCWDAVYAAVMEFPTSSTNDEQRFVVFLSDGRDESSTQTPSNIISAANSRNVNIYCIGFGAELSPDALEEITTRTAGQYYKAKSVGDLATRFEELVLDLGGQYTLRWSTLRRTSSNFTPSFDISYKTVSVSQSGPPYRPTDHAGNVLHGRLRIPDYSHGINQESHSASVYLRAVYVPRYVRRIRLYVRTSYSFTATSVPSASGGLCGGWPAATKKAAGGEDDYWVELASSNPQNPYTAIPYGAFGNLLRFDFTGLPAGVSGELFQQIAVDNTIYAQTGGQSLEVEGWTQPPEPKLQVSPMVLRLTSADPHAVVTVTNAGAFTLSWTATCADPGITVVPSHATGNNTDVTITATDLTARAFSVEFRSDLDAEDIVTIDGEVNIRNIILSLPGDVPLALVGIPLGSFQMGRYPGEQGSVSFEEPQHTVTIGANFYMGMCELTKRQWQAVMGTTPWSGQSSVLDDPDSPAVYVSWNDAQAFLTALNLHVTNTGQGPATFRLPSEAEWEYACRGGTTTRFYWGDDLSLTQIGNYAWFDGNASNVGENYAHVVGLKMANAWGLYDMSGNVWEWCEDYWHDNYTGAPSDGSAWLSPTSSYRVVRGGSWNYAFSFCRAATRSNFLPASSNFLYGFRLARTQ